MYFSPFFAYAGITVVTGIASRIWVNFRRDRAARKAMNTPLFPSNLLSEIFTPFEGANDDPNILSELNATLSHLNRQAFAEEFWNLDKDLTRYYKQIPGRSRPTMERALLRLIGSDEKWLQIVGAKTCAGLKLTQASDFIVAALKKNQSIERFKVELESCLKQLTSE